MNSMKMKPPCLNNVRNNGDPGMIYSGRSNLFFPFHEYIIYMTYYPKCTDALCETDR